MFSDLKYAVRSLSKTPWFTAVVIVTLALGIGVNTTVFSWTRAVLLNPLRGVEDAQRLVTLEALTPAGGYIDSSYPDFRDYRDQSRSLAGVIAFHDRPLSFGPDDRPQRVWAEFVSGNFFDVLGVRPIAGRFFSAEEQEEVAGRHAVAVISEPFWRRIFNADPTAIGRTIRLNGRELTVIGVASGQFMGTVVGLSFDVWVPAVMLPLLSHSPNWLEDRSDRGFHLMARLQPGVPLSAARAEIRTMARRLSRQYPQTNEGIGATLLPIHQAPYGVQSRLGTLLQILLGAGAVVLLIVCANVANLLLVRATARQKEFSVRLALGATRWRIIGQLLTESMLLSGLGGLLGVLLATKATSFLRFFIPATTYPIAVDFSIDSAVLAFTVSIAVLAGVVFGLAPALQATASRRLSVLQDGGRGNTSGARSNRLRSVLVTSEVALALLALIGAGLFLNSFHQARRIDPGFDPSNVLLAALNFSERGYDREQGLLFLRRLRERIEALPGVRAVSYSEDVPLGFDGGSWAEVQVEGYTPHRNENLRVYRNPVASGYFDLMRIPFVAGRDFTSYDDTKSPPVVIVNETFGRRFFAGQSSLGRRVHFYGRDWTVIGVVKDIKYANLTESPQPYFYLPLEQFYHPSLGLGLHVRTEGRSEILLPTLQRELRALDPGVTLFEVFDLSDYIGAAWFAQRIAATLLSVLGAVALLLAALGLFSVLAYSVSQRSHEFGIRMAIGARAADVAGLVVRQGLRLVFIGIGAGVLASFALTPLVSSMLLVRGATDAMTYILMSVLLVLVAVLACWVPARRASRVDPMVALRME